MVLITKAWAAEADLKDAVTHLEENPETASHFAKTLDLIKAAQEQLDEDEKTVPTAKS